MSTFTEKISTAAADKVAVITFREYCRQKASEARHKGTVEAQNVAMKVPTFFIREDFEDYAMESRDAEFRTGLIEDDQIDI